MHIDIDLLPADYIMIEYHVPDDAIETLAHYPINWDAMPPYHREVQMVGAEWIKSARSLGLRVPASVFPTQHNLLINPAHPRFTEIKEVEGRQWTWPPRLITELRNRKG